MAGQQSTIGVNLKFSADISAAKRAMTDLQMSLSQINNIAAKNINPGTIYTKSLNEASHAAAQLRIQLQSAFNQDTGRLNLTKFNSEMQRSGMSLEKYKAQLTAIGPVGQQAFSKLAYNIATADTSTIKLSHSFQRLGATFANTLRYQFSTNIIMGFIQSISSAVSHVKDLNSSLNDIRIVTDYNIDKMKEFAVEANKAAKTLRTSTNEYAKASLIYFQQGLDDTKVKQRTDLTIKMANVTKQSVSEVSDQLTAIWNNFDNGTQSLEHYVDVMVALGAATASSSEEISEGLNKFAAVAETVGLSYEYAASALATVTATTRQSADIVGTAFKTLFARIQDLELGKTLDDGTSLGQYSQSLAAVGINIKDTSGQMKDMNTILDEMGAKWNTLNKDQQVALAQNVAGVRQYTQLIALMDNWGTFQENLNTSLTSSGALQKQADTYAESWDAASKKVKASLETIYSNLLNDEFFIDATNGLASLIEFIDNLIESLGGLPGLLSIISLALTKVFSTSIANGINNMAIGLRSLTASGRQRNMEIQQQASEMAKTSYGTTGAGGQQSVLSEKQANLQIDYVRNKDKMLVTDQQIYEIRLKELDKQKDIVHAQLEENRALEDNLKLLMKLSKAKTEEEKKKKFGFGTERITNSATERYEVENGISKKVKNARYYLGEINTVEGVGGKGAYLSLDEKQRAQAYNMLKSSSGAVAVNQAIGFDSENLFSPLTDKSGVANAQKYKEALNELQGRLKNIGVTAQEVTPQLRDVVGPELGEKYKALASSVQEAMAKLEGLDLETAEGRKEAEDLAQKIREANLALEDEAMSMQRASQEALELNGEDKQLIENTRQVGAASGQAQGDLMRYGLAVEDTGERIRKTRTKVSDLGSVLVATAQGISSITMAFQSFRGILDVLNNNDMTFWEKLLSITSSLAMVIPMVSMGIQSLTSVEWKNTAGKIINAAATWGQVQAEDALQRERNQTTRKTVKQTIVEGVKTAKDKTVNAGRGIKNGFLNIGNKWNEAALSSDKNFELQTAGKNKGKYKILSGDGAGSFASKEVAGKMAGKSALKGAAKGLGKAGLAAAIVVAAIAAGKAIYNAADEAYNRDENAAKRAEASAKRLADAYGKASDKFNELKSSMDTYQDSIKSIDDLAKGTVEYTEAIYNANEEALKLISTNKIMADQYTTTAEGLIVFNEGVLENIKLQELQRKNAAMMASTIANQEARDLRTTADTTQFLRKDVRSSNREVTAEDWNYIGKGTGVGIGAGAVVGLGVGLKFGSAAGSWAGPIGAAIGAAAGLIVGALGGVVGAIIDQNEATKNEKKAIETLSDAYNKMGNAALTPENMKKLLGDVGIDDENLIESLNKNSKELEKLLIEMKANTEARRAENINMARQQFSTMDAAFTSFDGNIQNTMAKLAGDRMLKRQEEIEYDKKDYRHGRWWTFGIAKASTDEGKEQFDKWIKDQGIDLKNYNFKGDRINYKYYDEEGKVQKASLSYDDLAAWQEGQEIAKETEESYQKLLDDVWAMSQEVGGEGLLTILGGQDVNTLTQDQIDSLTNAYESGTFNEILAKYGEETGVDYAQAVENAINNWDYDTALTNYARKTQQEMDTILAQGAEATGNSKYALESYAETLMENSEALQNFDDKFNELDSKKIATEMAVANAKFAKGVVSLNKALKDNLDILQKWNEESLDTWEAVAQVQTALEEAFGVKVSADYVKDNLEDIKKLADGDTSSLEALQQAAAKDFVLNLAISDDAKGNFVAMINQFISAAEAESNGLEIDVGATMDLDSYTNQLNKMLEAGDITAEEVKKTFAAIGYAVDIKTTKKEVKNTSEFSMLSPDGKEWSGTITNTSVMDVPYIAGENTEEQGEQITTSTGDNVTVGNKTSGKGFTYTGGSEAKGNLLANVAEESKKAKKALTDEIDAYKDINQQLEDMERLLNRISKAKDNAFGNTKLGYLDEEIKRQKELIALEKDKLKISETEMNDARKELHSGFKVDEKGNIINYVDYLNSIAGVVSEDKYNEIKDSADKYIESRTTFLNQWDKVLDEENELFSKELETVTLKIDLDISLVEDDLALLDFQIEALGDGWDKASERFAVYAQQIDAEEKKISSYREGIRGILGASVENLTDEQILNPETFMSLLGDKELTSEQIEQLREYRDGLLESTIAMLEMKDTIKEDMISCFEGWSEEIDNNAEAFDRASKTIQGYRDIIDLVGKDNLGITDEFINSMNKKNIENSINALEASRSTLENTEKSLESARAAYDEAVKAGDEEGAEFWKSTVDKLEEETAKRKEEMMTNWKDSLQAAADALQDSVDQIVDTFGEAMAGMAGSLDELSRKYEQQQEIGERYLQDYEKIYNLSKLNRDITNSINETDNVKAKSQLRDLQEEIYQLQESGAEMTQYEVDELQARYELRLAEIALEEAQNAKSQVQMRRDSEGNWSYVYTADQNKISEAQQNVEDKMFNAQNVNNKRIKEIEQQLVNIGKEYTEAYAEIMADQSLTDEQRKARLEETYNFFNEKYQWLTDQLQIALGNSKRLYEEDWQTYSEITGYKISSNQDWVDSFNETTLSQITGYNTLADYQESFRQASETMLQNLISAYKTYQTDLDRIMKAAGTSINDFATNAGTDIDNVAKKSKDAADEIKRIGTEGSKAFKTLVEEAVEWWPKYKTKMEEYVSWNTTWATAVNGIITNYSKLNNMKFTELEAELDRVLGKLAQVQGTDYTTVEPNPKPTTNGKYYGTYYDIEGNLRRTQNSYDTENEAEYHARVERGEYANRLLNQHRYNSAIRQGDTTYAYKTQGDILSEIKQYGYTGTVEETAVNAEKESPLSDKNFGMHDVFKTSNGLYVAKGTYLISLDNSGGIRFYRKGSNTQPGTITEESLKEIYEHFGDEGMSEDIKKKYTAGTVSFDASQTGWTPMIYNGTKDRMESWGQWDSITEKFVKPQSDLKYKISKRGMSDEQTEYYLHPNLNEEYAKYLSNPDDYDYSTTFYWIPKHQLKFTPALFDTGGYTGTWDSSGRLAMLHQKEIVLNAHDTENFLSAVNIVRDIASVIDLRAAAQQSALAALATATTANHTMQTLQQEVTIHAEFPNATQRTEIEAAFDTLLNRASQFANRKN